MCRISIQIQPFIGKSAILECRISMPRVSDLHALNIGSPCLGIGSLCLEYRIWKVEMIHQSVYTFAYILCLRNRISMPRVSKFYAWDIYIYMMLYIHSITFLKQSQSKLTIQLICISQMGLEGHDHAESNTKNHV